MGDTPVGILLQAVDTHWASSRFRGFWLQEAAPDLFTAYPADYAQKAGEHRVIVFQKRHTPLDISLASQLRHQGVKVVYDMTDPLWWWNPKEVGAMIQLADVVICSNEGLGEAIRATGEARRVCVIPDRMLPSAHPTVAEHGKNDPPVLIWFGMALNRFALTGYLPILGYVYNLGHPFVLRVMDDLPSAATSWNDMPIEHVAWTLETFHANLVASDIAVLPPYPGPWGLMKSNNKAVSAWWAGLPVIAGDDPAELIELLERPKLRAKQGREGRALAEAQYDIAQSVAEWRDLLSSLE